MRKERDRKEYLLYFTSIKTSIIDNNNNSNKFSTKINMANVCFGYFQLITIRLTIIIDYNTNLNKFNSEHKYDKYVYFRYFQLIMIGQKWMNIYP